MMRITYNFLRSARVLGLGAGLLWCASLAQGSTIAMTFDGVNGAAAFGYYVGPYFGTLNDSPVDLFCVDSANEVWIGEIWQANLSMIVDGSDLSLTRYGSQAQALTLYQEEAWLTGQFAMEPASEYGDIQATMWHLFNPDTAPRPSSSYWLDQAQSSYAGADYSTFRVVTNLGPVTPTGQVQEFLTRLDMGTPLAEEAAPTPEPSTCVLVGFTLMGLGVTLKRRAFPRSTQDRCRLALRKWLLLPGEAQHRRA
jgi:hypothetical protein